MSQQRTVAMRRLSILMVVVGVGLILSLPFAFDVWPRVFAGVTRTDIRRTSA
jgi:hypothetical protein